MTEDTSTQPHGEVTAPHTYCSSFNTDSPVPASLTAMASSNKCCRYGCALVLLLPSATATLWLPGCLLLTCAVLCCAAWLAAGPEDLPAMLHLLPALAPGPLGATCCCSEAALQAAPVLHPACVVSGRTGASSCPGSCCAVAVAPCGLGCMRGRRCFAALAGLSGTTN